ncbi:MAG: peptidylprolyl isomerase [Candidatus Gastranaerophilaceae bacterium]|jgi:parvulin-like peptidyl-prolyl isomerase
MKKNFYVVLLLFVISFFCFPKDSVYIKAEELKTKSKEVCMVEQVKASHILVPTKEEAITIKEKILAGMSFEEAAETYSQCPSGKSGGDLGYFRKGQMVPEFEQAAFTNPVGQISEPVQTQFGWHLILVTDKK